MSVARTLEDRLPADAAVTLVNDGPDHLVRHEVHRVIRRPSLAETITVPLDGLLDRARLRTEAVESLDTEAGHVELAGGETFSYDYGVVAFGSETATYGIDGVREHAIPLKSVADARAIREATLAAMGVSDDRRETTPGGDPTSDDSATDDTPAATPADAVGNERDESAADDRTTHPTDGGATDARIAVCGAGLSGIQAAGEIAALAEERGATVGEDVRVTLIEQQGTVAPAFPASFARAVRAELTDRGVTIRTDTTVRRVADDAVETDTGELPADVTVWTGGITGVPAADGDRPVVRADLRLTDRTLAVGDAARVVDNHGEAVPASAAAAVREASVAATNVTRLVESHEQSGRPRLDRYTFDVPGWLVSVGDGAVAQLGPTVLRGRPAIAAKATVGAGYLTGVGAVRNAVSLVESELGLDAAE